MTFRTRVLVRPTTWLALALCALFGFPAGAAAQYFGQNKVQYETFDFRVMHTPHFDIYYYPAESLAAYDGARMAERWYARHAEQFNYQLSAKKPIIFYADHPDWEQTNVVSDMLPEGVGGVTEPLQNRVTLPFTGNYADNDHVIGHELVHSFQFDIAENPAATAGPKEGSDGGGGGLARMDALPQFLIEGMAEYLSLGRIDPLTAMWMRDAALYNDVPSLNDLTNSSKYFPYRYGEALWAYIGGRWSDAAVADVYRAALKMGWNNALIRVLGVSSDTLSKQWDESIRETYMPTVAGRTAPEFAGERVIVGKSSNFTNMNVAPAVSPDGKYVAFYSSRSLFSTELYIADARTGKIVKQLTHPSIDSHFDALDFVYSAGTWSPDSKQFAFITTAKGNNEITVVNVASGHTMRSIRPKNVGAINTLAWSPDGTRIAFSGMHGGISDLYIYDLKSGDLKQMMDDRYADLQPAWSPDGSTIAFATDRGPGTSFDSLTFSPLGIGLLDVSSGAIRLLSTFPNAQSINPQYAPDGRSIYFIGNPGGFPDIYRLDLTNGQLYEVTKVATGVSGITATSPALSVASKSGRVMFSVFQHGGYGIYGLEGNLAQGQPVTATNQGVLMAGALPPWNALQSSTVLHQLRQPLMGLPAAGTVFAVSSYNPGLSLEYLGTPGVGVQVGGPFGTGAVGGVAMAFGDILGNRTVGAQLGVQGSIKNTAGQLYYLNSKHRWNWFVSGSHIPYLTGFTDAYVQNFGSGGQSFDGVVYRQVIQRQYDDAITIGAQYPFSTTRRFEINAGFRHLGYGTEVDSVITDLNGIPIAEGQGGVPSPAGLNLGQAGAALVGDNTFFGFTSPVSGTRYRLEADPTIGDLTFTTAMLDFRRYFFFTRPVTIAFRGLTYGRYGKDAESNRFFPLFVGDPVLIRGYDFNSFDPSECALGNSSGNPNSCPVFDRLLGSKVAVANFELRIPLIGTQAFGLLPWGFIPVEIAPFFDAGVAWDSDSTPTFTFSETSTARIPVFSTGISARLNVLGYVVAELYYAHPFQRPGKNWVFGFQLQPGW